MEQAQQSPSEAQTIPAKYVFMDVVGFSRDRSVEAQSYIVEALNRIVLLSLSKNQIPDEKRLLLPTGDGICIALLNIVEPYDIHVQLAITIIKYVDWFQDYELESIDEKHADSERVTHVLVSQEEEYISKIRMREFQVRIGIEANLDNLVIDINGRTNIAGAGINMAQRVMGLADGNQILLGQPVFNELRHREKYMHSLRSLGITQVKHTHIQVYQLVGDTYEGLNNDYPKALKPKQEVKPQLTKIAAYYFAHAIMQRTFLTEKYGGSSEYAPSIFLWLLADNSVKKSEATTEPARLHFENTVRIKQTLDALYDHINSINFTIQYVVEEYILSNVLDGYIQFFEGYYDYRFLTKAGQEKLKEEWPQIWAEFELDGFI
jgi:hypothetical protein